jgi:predicted adenylyl cyclase CyaB
MAKELETKVLDVNEKKIISRLKSVGAKKVLKTKLRVYWFNIKGKKTYDWYLRIRRYSDGKNEVTWKGKSIVHGVSRSHKEINFSIESFEKIFDLFLEMGLENYAFQEKYRTSWEYKEWHFDLDRYPGMNPYLEIEAPSEKLVQEAIRLLKLNSHETWNEGEKTLIEGKYKLNWHKMQFKT